MGFAVQRFLLVQFLLRWFVMGVWILFAVLTSRPSFSYGREPLSLHLATAVCATFLVVSCSALISLATRLLKIYRAQQQWYAEFISPPRHIPENSWCFMLPLCTSGRAASDSCELQQDKAKTAFGWHFHNAVDITGMRSASQMHCLSFTQPVNVQLVVMSTPLQSLVCDCRQLQA